MASSKTKKPAAKPAAKPAKAVKGAKVNAKAAKGGKPAKGAAAPKKSKAWIVPLVMLAVLLGVGANIYLRARYLASLKFDMVRTARNIPQGRDQGQAMAVVAVAGDKKDQVFILEGNDSVPFRLQRFDSAQSPNSLVYKAPKPELDIKAGADIDVDVKGDVYVLERDGDILNLDNDLKFKRLIKTGINLANAIGVNDSGRIYVACAEENKVSYFRADGAREGDFGAPGSESGTLVAPVRMRLTADNEIVVVERTEQGLRGRILRPDHTLRKTFLVDNLQNCEPVKLGVNGDGKALFNDHMGSRGIVAWDLATGKFFGESQITKDGEKFISPGALGANRYNHSIFVHTVTGLIKCVFPPKDAPASQEDGE